MKKCFRRVRCGYWRWRLRVWRQRLTVTNLELREMQRYPVGSLWRSPDEWLQELQAIARRERFKIAQLQEKIGVHC